MTATRQVIPHLIRLLENTTYGEERARWPCKGYVGI
jgi:hypothetical protein